MGVSDELVRVRRGGFAPFSSLPAWNTGAVNGWIQISGTNLSSVEPASPPTGTPSCKVTAWTSFALHTVTSKLYCACQGGHTDYSGNEVDVIDLSVAVPAWSEIRAPTASVSTANYYSDGRPSSVHSYYGVTIDETNNRIMLFGGSRYADGAVKNVTDSFSIASADYNAAGTHPDMPSSASTGLNFQEIKAFCRNPSTDDVYAFANFNVGKWSRSGNTWSMPISGQTTSFVERTASAWDTTRGRVVLLGDGICATFDPNTNTYTNQTPSGEAIAANADMAMVYVQAIDRFLIRLNTSGGTVYRMHPTTFAIDTVSTTGGASVPAITNGPFNKFIYVPSQSGVVYCPSYTGNLWFMRTH